MKEALPLDSIKCISLSKYSDGFVTIHCRAPFRDLLVDMGTYISEFIAAVNLELKTRTSQLLPIFFVETVYYNNSRTNRKTGIEDNYVFQELSKNDKLWKTALPDSSAIFVKGNKSQTVVYYRNDK